MEKLVIMRNCDFLFDCNLICGITVLVVLCLPPPSFTWISHEHWVWSVIAPAILIPADLSEKMWWQQRSGIYLLICNVEIVSSLSREPLYRGWGTEHLTGVPWFSFFALCLLNLNIHRISFQLKRPPTHYHSTFTAIVCLTCECGAVALTPTGQIKQKIFGEK